MNKTCGINLVTFKILISIVLGLAVFSGDIYGADLTDIINTHPRIFLNSSNLADVQTKVLAGGALNAEYENMKGAMAGSPGKAGWSYAGANADIQTVLAMACAFIYQMEGDASWTTAPKLAAAESHGFSFGTDDGGHYLEMYAMVYDWLYSQLSSAERTTIRDNIAAIADAFLVGYNGEIKLDDYHNYMTQWINGFMSAGLAIYDEDPARGAQYINFATQALYEGHTFTNAYSESTTWKFKDSVTYSGGYADFEGVAYYRNAIPEIARAIEAWDTATDRSNAMWNTQFPLLQNTGYLLMYGHTANNNVVKFEDANPTTTTISSKYMGILSLLEGRFQDGYIKSFIDTKFSGVNDWQYGQCYKVFYLLFYDPAVATTDYTGLNTDRACDNYYFMKSGWGAGDTYVAFKAGTHYGYHSHSDHNGFFIWDNGNILTASGGMYESGCQTFDDPTKNLTAWNRQTVAGNAITVYDATDDYPWKVNLGTSAPNAGGQRMPYLRHNTPYSAFENSSNMPWSGYKLINDAATTEIFKFANVKASNLNSAIYAYVRSDATKAYSNNYSGTGNNPNDKVDLIEREFVYIKPNYIITYDRVNTKSSAYTKSYIIHSIGAPDVYDTSWNTPGAGVTDYNAGYKARMDTGSSRLFMQTLYPSSNFKYHVIGGTNFENYIESTATNYAPDCAVQDYNMRWRIEVQPTDAQQNYVFLNMLEITDDSQSDITSSSLVTASSGDMRGIFIDDSTENKVAMFSSDVNGANESGPIIYQVNATTDTVRYILFNLPPSTSCDISITRAVGVETVTVTTGAGAYTSSSEGVLNFDSNLTVPRSPTDLAIVD